jgi:NTE family protein
MNMQLNTKRPSWRGRSVERTLDLVLQGSGAHGAFGWGILDKLLEDGHIDVGGIAATGTGAMNGAVYAYGNMTGGKAQARELLETFWRKASERVSWGHTLRRSPLEHMFAAVEPISRHWFEQIIYMLSPNELNPLNFDPMRTILEMVVDFGELRRCKTTRLSITATNVRTGLPCTFVMPQITVDAVLASACQPTISQAVEIDGEYYWDGVYSGMPNLVSAPTGADGHDILIGQINPIRRRNLPRRTADIQDRINEITVHNAFAHEIGALAVTGPGKDSNMGQPSVSDGSSIRVHTICSNDVISDQFISSKFDTSWRFLTRLRDAGRLATELWLETNLDKHGI